MVTIPQSIKIIQSEEKKEKNEEDRTFVTPLSATTYAQ